MSFPHQIFKAYDIRGIVDIELSEHLAMKIGRALGSEARLNQAAGGGEFFVGRDGRVSGARISAAVIRGIRASGCDVVDIGMVPTPLLYFAAARTGGTGVEVTASHNPSNDNGMKMMIGGDTLFGDAIQSIKQRVLDDNFSIGDGALREQDVLAAYQSAIVADIHLAKKMKVVLDCGNGVGGVIAPQVLRAIGCEVIELFCTVDGTFPNHHPDPSDPKNLADLIAAVQQHKADFGIALDGDGDRLGVVSDDGAIIWSDRLMLLFVENILRKHQKISGEKTSGEKTDTAEIIFDVKCSRLLPRAIKAHGGNAIMCKTGHSFIKKKIKESGALFAGEMSGHLFFNDRWGGFDDGIYAAARLCELLGTDNRAPGEVFATLPNTINTPELRLEMPTHLASESHAFVDELVAAARTESGFEDAVISNLDGLRVDFEYGFGLIRASNTTPTIIMRFESDTEAQMKKIQSHFRKLLHATRQDLELPF